MRPAAIVPVILCGGSGARLWPLSRDDMPKQLLTLTGEQTLLQETARRALSISGCAPDRTITVTSASLTDQVTGQLLSVDPGCARHILSEPAARNTAAAVALAALHAAAAFGEDALLWILPSDHHIDDEAALAHALRRGVAAAEQGAVVTFGITPTHADTGYGYINAGVAWPDHEGVSRIARFVEKPDGATAQAFIDTESCLWNSGMFLCRASAVLAQFARHAPDILAATEDAARAGTTAHPDAALYALIPALAFDKAIMERSDDGAVVPCDPKWSDIGSWDRLWGVRAKDDAGNACRGDVLAVDSTDCLIESLSGRLIACAGLRNIVAVDTGDAVLVADRTNADAMNDLIQALKTKS